MAVDGGFIGNGQQGIGQGLAFVLPESNAAKYAMQLGQQRASEMRAIAAAQAKRQQDLVEQYQQDFTSAKLPEYWATAGKPINEAFNKYQQDAASYMAQTGKNPFKNPEFIKQYNDNVLLPARQSKEIEQAGAKLIPMVAADNDNRFTEDSKQAVLRWWDTAQKDPSAVFGQPVPQLQGTPSGVQDFYKTIKPVSIKSDNGKLSTTVADTSAMKAQAYEMLQDPRWNNMLATKYDVNPAIGDIGSVFNKDGKRVWYTNPTAVGHLSDEILANPTVPHNAEILQRTGVVPDQPYAKEKLADIITKQNKGYGSAIEDAGRYGESLISKERNSKPDFTPYQIFQMNWKRTHPTGEKAPTEPTYFQDLSERIRGGDAASRQELGDMFLNNPSYLNAPRMFNEGGKIKIKVPAKYKTDPDLVKKFVEENPDKPVPANADRALVEKEHTYTLDPAKPVQFTNTLAQIYRLATGESVTPTKASTLGGKGKIPGGQSPVGKTPAGTPLVNKSKKAATDYGL